MTDSAAPTALVSWAHRDPQWSDEQAEEWIARVVMFATLLRFNGVDADLDLWNESDPYIDWTRWGQLQVQQQQFVIILVSTAWRQRWEGTNSPKLGAGAVSEADTLKGLFNHDQKAFQRRTLIAVLPGVGVDVIPPDLHRLRRAHVRSLDTDGIEPLLRMIHQQPLHVKPKLGQIPTLPSMSYLPIDTPASQDIAAKRGELDGVQSGTHSQGEIATPQAPFDRPPLGESTSTGNDELPLSEVLKDKILGLSETTTMVLQRLSQEEPSQYIPSIAFELSSQGSGESTAERLNEALRPVEEALTVIRRRAESELGVAAGLSIRAVILNKAGRADEALQANDEALEILRRSPQDKPTSRRAGLAAGLINRAAILSKAGRADEALQANDEALEILRRLSQDKPTSRRAGLAAGLINRAGILSRVGRADEALQVSDEALEVLRKGLIDDPPRFLRSLANALMYRAAMLNRVGRTDEALQANDEALEVLRKGVVDDPAKFNPSLAEALRYRAAILSRVGRADEALQANDEALKLNDEALKLNNRIFPSLSRAELTDEALQANDKALEVLRKGVVDDPAKFNPSLAVALRNRAAILSRAGCTDEALQAIDEVRNIHRQETGDDHSRFILGLATILNDRIAVLKRAGRTDEALQANDEALEVLRRGVVDDPAKFNPSLAVALKNRAAILSRAGRTDEALQANDEAATFSFLINKDAGI